MKLKAFAAIFLTSFFVHQIVAQDEPQKAESGGVQKRAIIVASPQAGDGPQAIQIQSVELSGDASASFIDSNVFSFSTNGEAPMVGFGSPASNGGLMNLLNNKSIRDEIELVDDQYKKMQDFYKSRQAEVMKEVQSLIKPAISGDSKSSETVKLRGKKIKEMIQKQTEESEKKLKDLLLPHQLKRLEQVSHQVKMKNAGTLGALTRGKLKEELDLSDDDVERLQEKSKDIEKKLNEEIAKLRAKAKKDLLNELSAKQKRKLDELLGDEFEYKQTDWRSRLKEIQQRMEKKKEK